MQQPHHSAEDFAISVLTTDKHHVHVQCTLLGVVHVRVHVYVHVYQHAYTYVYLLRVHVRVYVRVYRVRTGTYVLEYYHMVVRTY